MNTITLQIGNTDDKLPQCRWHDYVEALRTLIEGSGVAVHFFGAPPNWTPWQNAAWVFVCETGQAQALKEAVADVAGRFGQESVAWTVGATEFVGADTRTAS